MHGLSHQERGGLGVEDTKLIRAEKGRMESVSIGMVCICL